MHAGALSDSQHSLDIFRSVSTMWAQSFESSQLDPLQLQREIMTKTHKYPSGFELLDEVPIHVVIFDFLELGNPRRIWANAPWLEYSKKTLKQYQEIDFAASVPGFEKNMMHEVGQQVQIRRQIVNVKIPLYPIDKPLPALLMHQPVLVESREHPLIMITQWNNFGPDDDRSTMEDPMSFDFKNNICQQAHHFPEALELLNELPAYFIVYDFQDPTRPKQLWASSAWLHALKKTQNEFQTSQFSAVTPTRINEELLSILRQVQNDRSVVSLECVLDCLDPPVTAQAVFRPLLFSQFQHPVVFCTIVTPPESLMKQLRSIDSAETGNSTGNSTRSAEARSHLFERQVSHLVDVGATIFDVMPGPTFGKALWTNWYSAHEYGIALDCRHFKTHDGNDMDIRMVCSTFMWDEEEKDIFREIASIPPEGHSVVKTVKKKQGCGKTGEEGDGQPRWYKLSFTPCKNPNNGNNTLLLLESDVSSLMAAQAELQAKNDLKDQFLQCMSHELRTPLNGIIGLSAAICALPQVSKNVQNALQTIEQSALQLNALVSDILDTAACMAEDFSLNYSHVSLASTVEIVCDIFRPRLNPGVVLYNRIASSKQFVIEADEERIHKALSHLIENALKFTMHGSIEVTGYVEDGEVTVLVRDTGCGVPAHVLERVWQHFQQGDMSETRAHGGTGLGLALVKLIAEAHGGSVIGTSRQWEGGGSSTFGFTLPVQPRTTSFNALVSLDYRDRKSVV